MSDLPPPHTHTPAPLPREQQRPASVSADEAREMWDDASAAAFNVRSLDYMKT